MTTSHEYAMIADVVGEILDRRGLTAPQPNVVGRLASLYAATPHPRIDGKITIADALSAGALTITGFFISLPASASVALITKNTDMFPISMGWSNLGVAALVGICLVSDVLDPAGRIEEWREWREYRTKFTEFKEWLNAQRYGHPREIEHTIKVEVKDELGDLRLFGFDAAQSQRVAEFAHLWLEVQETTEKHFVGVGRIWSGGKGERGRDGWGDFKRELFKNNLAHENSSGTWDFLPAGRRMMYRIAEQYPPTPDDAGDYLSDAGK